MKLFLLSLLFAVPCLGAETDTNLYDRVFFLCPPLADGIRDPSSYSLSSEEKNKKWRNQISDAFGVQWPAGSELVQEFIYPSEYFTESSITNSECEGFSVLLPADFTTKEVGTTCSVTLESSGNDDGLFTVSTQVTYTTLKGWASFESLLVNKSGVRKETNAHPIFSCLSLSGKQVIRPKETVLVGGGRLDDEWVGYVFVTLDTPLSVNRNEIYSTQKRTKEVEK
jgi:hypothetical protein